MGEIYADSHNLIGGIRHALPPANLPDSRRYVPNFIGMRGRKSIDRVIQPVQEGILEAARRVIDDVINTAPHSAKRPQQNTARRIKVIDADKYVGDGAKSEP